MLHKDVLMADIDVDQWRNAQALLLRSAKDAQRIVVIHEQGTVLKLRHTDGIDLSGRVETVDDPHRVARSLYEANQETTDFVAVMERDAVDTYFAAVQDAWDIEADLDEFVQQTYAKLDDFADGIVTFPGRARETLGLQWRIGASLHDVDAAIRSTVPGGSTVILGVHDGSALWASLILDIDDHGRITSITTADPSRVDITGSRNDVFERLINWQADAGKSVSLALLMDQDAADAFLAAPAADKGRALAELAEARKLLVRR